MGMNPRILRPGSTFTPRSISGLALWLDAADTSSLFQNSDGTVPATTAGDPVGYWRDKSGNGRHMLQPTGSLRPTVGTQGSRKAIAFNGTTQWMRQERTNYQRRGMFVVWRRTGTPVMFSSPLGANNPTINAATLGGSGYSSSDAASITWYNSLTHYSANSASNKATALRYNAANIATADANNYLVGFRAAQDTTAVNLVYVEASSSNAANWAHFAGVEPYDPSRTYPCQLCEVLFYNNTLTAAQVAQAERYLASKWGITLAPQVSNADAQDWVNRVYANGGTVSSTTASAVNTFCNAINAAGIRDRFYRLNLFCGTGLSACLVPLYRGPSLGGTQYGNTTDTNNGGFVSGDYSEAAGLSRLVSEAKRLDTGLATSALPSGAIDSGHLAVWHGPLTGSFAATGESDPTLIGASNGSTDRAHLILSFRSATNGNDSARWGKATAVTESSGAIGLTKPSAFLLGQRTSATNLELWRNGAIVGTNATSTTGIAGITHSILVFGFNNSGTPAGELNALLLRGYSVGDDMTSTQALAFRAAWAAFNTALGRTA